MGTAPSAPLDRRPSLSAPRRPFRREPFSVRYHLYGLAAETDRPLPGLRPHASAGGPPDLRMWIGAEPPGAPAFGGEPWYVADRETDEGEPTLTIQRADGGGWYRLRYADGTAFTVDAAGARIGCTWAPPMTLEDMATYLLGPVLGFALRLRGLTCLHASAVAVDGGAVLVCGPAGAGKSTTAAALAARGHAVLADDVAALDASGGGVTVRAAYPHLRLWPDAVRALRGPGADLPPLTPNWDKRYLDLASAGDAAFHATPLPVRAVVLLAGREETDAPRVEPVPPSEALLALVANTYLGWAPERAWEARDLALYGRLMRTAPVVRAVPHADPARLPALCHAIEAVARDQRGAAAVRARAAADPAS